MTEADTKDKPTLEPLLSIFERVEAHALGPNDVVVLKVNARLHDEQRARIGKLFDETLGTKRKMIILEPGLELAVLREAPEYGTHLPVLINFEMNQLIGELSIDLTKFNPCVSQLAFGFVADPTHADGPLELVSVGLVSVPDEPPLRTEASGVAAILRQLADKGELGAISEEVVRRAAAMLDAPAPVPTPFGWWDKFNEEFTRDPADAARRSEGENHCVPLFTMEKLG